ncbi:uncharacterized protein LOC128218414 [Mya arenaria]|uniref:uncharacterized protein LOC128218414 n=1 Tax=Mya arenaria TaxID=6604 RepID=UPI0022E0FBD9|nr:uncharacterized protein LOC128218414 [Mya arenaria]
MVKNTFGFAVAIFTACYADLHKNLQQSCDVEYGLDDFIDDEILVVYDGAQLSRTCKVTFEQEYSLENLCVEAERFNVADEHEDVTLEYHSRFYSPAVPDKIYTKYDTPIPDWCSSSSRIIISFDSSTTRRGDADIRLRVYKQDSGAENFADDMISAASPVVLVVAGVVGGVIILCIIISAVVALICYRRRRSRAGHVHSPATPSTVAHQPQHRPHFSGNHGQPQAGNPAQQSYWNQLQTSYPTDQPCGHQQQKTQPHQQYVSKPHYPAYSPISQCPEEVAPSAPTPNHQI